LARAGVAAVRELEQGGAEELPLVSREAERDEEDGLEAPNRMGRRQQVVTDLRVFDNSAVGIGKAHEVSVLRSCVDQQGFTLRSAQL
jgi:hypothetical protein